MSVFRAIAHEVHEARQAMRPISHVRVTPDALAGSVAALPITPERARTIRLRAFPGGTVEADFGETARLLEIAIHPDDWRTLLTERDAVGVYAVNVGTGGVREIYGIPVVES